MICPQFLKKNDKIAIVAPAGRFSIEMLEVAEKTFLNLGYNCNLFAKHSEKYGYLANSDEQRASEINMAFSDTSIRAIFALRGGYGSARIIDKLDFENIKRNPKIFCGFSDISFLLNSIYKKTGLITFHSQMPARSFTSFTQTFLFPLLKEGKTFIELTDYNIVQIFPGNIKGILLGGNLCILASMCGSEYEPDFTGKIVFLEEVGEEPYRIDRMLTQLLLTKTFKSCKGILLGNFKKCEAENPASSFSLEEIIHERLGNLNIPVYSGLPCGHIDDSISLAIGGLVEFDYETKILKINTK